MTPSKARKLADQTQPAVLTIRRTLEILKGEQDLLLVILYDNLYDAHSKIKHVVSALHTFEGS